MKRANHGVASCQCASLPLDRSNNQSPVTFPRRERLARISLRLSAVPMDRTVPAALRSVHPSPLDGGATEDKSALRERPLRMNLLNKWPRLVLSPATGGYEGSQALHPPSSRPPRDEGR
jgi:hypothetical protein